MEKPDAETVQTVNATTVSEPGAASAPMGTLPPAPTTTTTAETPQPPTPTEAKPTSTKESLPEPQNLLTKRFTTVEWTALKEFRDLLPDIFANAFPDDPKARDTPITMWGVKIDPQSPRDAKVSVVLMKFLRARNLSVREAREMLHSTLRWRKLFDVEKAMQETFPEDLFGQLGHLYGKDREGRPVMYNVYGGHNDTKVIFADVELFIRWRVALHERMMQQLDFEIVDQTIQVHDYEGVGITSHDANSKNAAREAASIFQNYYPELLYKKFFINVPTLLNWIFWAFKSFISANTLAKMSVVGSGRDAIHKALGPYIDDKELPKRYGGTAEGF